MNLKNNVDNVLDKIFNRSGYAQRPGIDPDPLEDNRSLFRQSVAYREAFDLNDDWPGDTEFHLSEIFIGESDLNLGMSLQISLGLLIAHTDMPQMLVPRLSDFRPLAFGSDLAVAKVSKILEPRTLYMLVSNPPDVPALLGMTFTLKGSVVKK